MGATDGKPAAEKSKYQLLVGCLVLISITTFSPLVFKKVQAAHIPINTTTLTWLTEFGKLIFSLIAYYWTENSFPSPSLLWTQKFYMYAAPALIYAAGNVAWSEILLLMPMSTAVVFVQLKVLLTALVSAFFLGRKYKVSQWLALGIITVGSMGTQYRPEFTIASAPMKAYFFVLINCFASAFGGVVTEFLFKGKSQAESIHFQNIQLYFWGIVILMVGQLLSGGKALEGFNHGLLLISVTNVSAGLAVAWVIKYVDAVAKSICNALTLVTVPIAGLLFLKEMLTFPLVTNGFSVVCASLLFTLLSY